LHEDQFCLGWVDDDDHVDANRDADVE